MQQFSDLFNLFFCYDYFLIFVTITNVYILNINASANLERPKMTESLQMAVKNSGDRDTSTAVEEGE